MKQRLAATKLPPALCPMWSHGQTSTSLRCIPSSPLQGGLQDPPVKHKQCTGWQHSPTLGTSPLRLTVSVLRHRTTRRQSPYHAVTGAHEHHSSGALRPGPTETLHRVCFASGLKKVIQRRLMPHNTKGGELREKEGEGVFVQFGKLPTVIRG